MPNDLALHEGRRMLIVTGPNMGGKSTYMRQSALIVILAGLGSYVPAESATIGPVDRIFTRIGAADDLAGGRSTFMVEMTEAANILNNATRDSLVLMDEIGRGTSTYDGLSLAWACARHIGREVGCLHAFRHALLRADCPRRGTAGLRERAPRCDRARRHAGIPARREGRARQPELRPAGRAARGRAEVGRRRGPALPRRNSSVATTCRARRTRSSSSTCLRPTHPGEADTIAELRSLDPEGLSPREALVVLFRLKETLDGRR